MLGPINAYQVQQQNVQSSQVRNPNSQPFLAQEQNTQRSERLNETRRTGEALADTNKSNAQTQSRDEALRDSITEDAKSLIAQGITERGSLLDVTA